MSAVQHRHGDATAAICEILLSDMSGCSTSTPGRNSSCLRVPASGFVGSSTSTPGRNSSHLRDSASGSVGQFNIDTRTQQQPPASACFRMCWAVQHRHQDATAAICDILLWQFNIDSRTQQPSASVLDTTVDGGSFSCVSSPDASYVFYTNCYV